MTWNTSRRSSARSTGIEPLVVIGSNGAAPERDTRELARRIRLHALAMTSRGGSSHIGAVFSMADILAVLYGGALRVDPREPRWPRRDRFILSKGHAGAGVYAA